MSDDMDQENPEERRTGRVRIIGAEPAGQAAAEPDEPTGRHAASGATEGANDDDTLFGTPLASDEGTETELPDWTDAPTGQVPAVLSRGATEPTGADADPWSALPAPSWREEHADWAQEEERFDPSILSGEQPLVDADGADAEREPWSFELTSPTPDEPAGPPAASEPTPSSANYEDDWLVVTGERPAVRPIDDFDDDETLISSVRAIPAPEGAQSTVEPDVAPVDPVAATAWPLSEPEEARSAIPEPNDFDATAAVPVVDPGDEALHADQAERRRGRPSRGGISRRLRVRAVPDDVANAASVPSEPTPVPEVPDRPPVRSRPVPRRSLTPPKPPAPEEQVQGGGRNVPVAVATGVGIGVLALICFKLGPVPSLVLVTVLVLLGVAEAYAAVRRGGYHPATLLGLVAAVSLMVATYTKGQAALPLVTVLLVAFTMIWYMIGVEHADPMSGTASTLFIYAWVAVFGSFAALLLNPTLFPDRHGIAFLLGAVIATVLYDVGALVIGGRMGRRPLAASISPQKTWEGAIGGAVVAIVGSGIIVHFISPWTLGEALLLGVVVSIVAPIGDLCESLIKRILGVMDMGRILPGHGGLLDRVDGLLFVLPATYYLVKAVHLG